MVREIFDSTGFPGPWPRPGIKIKLFIILGSENLLIYYNMSCRARAGKPGNDEGEVPDHSAFAAKAAIRPS
jgi:hypothetical protein